MPTRLCLEPRCPHPATYRGRCATHTRSNERTTHARRHFYNSKRWQITRSRVLFDQPLCECGQIATDVDHIKAIEDGGDPWSRNNLQGLCKACHSMKTNRELRAR
jgi:5-methylcytosine-specific restriction protein A